MSKPVGMRWDYLVTVLGVDGRVLIQTRHKGLPSKNVEVEVAKTRDDVLRIIIEDLATGQTEDWIKRGGKWYEWHEQPRT